MVEHISIGLERALLIDPNYILRDAIQRERLRTDEDLALSLSRYSQAYFVPDGDTSDTEKIEVIYEEERRIRVYVIRQLVDWLYSQDKPDSLIEVGSVGDISAALALPHTQVTSVDIDPKIFLNVPYNTLPKELFERLGVKKTMEDYGRDNFWKGKRRKLSFVERCVPNWKKYIVDACKLPFKNCSYDIALAQGPVTHKGVDTFIEEMVRVTKFGGHIATIMHEVDKQVNSPSTYDTGKYNTYPDIPLLDPQRAEALGLRQINIPDRFRSYENLATWQDDNGLPKAAGIVFQVFKKI